MVDTAFEALRKFDWGSDLSALDPIEEAAIAAAAVRQLARETLMILIRRRLLGAFHLAFIVSRSGTTVGQQVAGATPLLRPDSLEHHGLVAIDVGHVGVRSHFDTL